MNFSLKALSRVAFIAAASVVASCAPTGPSSPQNDLSISQKTIALTNVNTADTSDVALVCGCPFPLIVVSYTGDTSVIKYSIPMLGNTVSSFKVILKGEPAPARTYTSQLILEGGEDKFLDTITTTYIVP
jgi:hypothetical protein